MQMLTMNILREHDKPIILVNMNGFWDPFMNVLDAMEEQGFLYPGTKRQIAFSDR